MRFNFCVFRDLDEIAKVYPRNFLIREIPVVYCYIVTGFTCDHVPVEVFSVQSRSLPDPKHPLSSTVRPQAIDSAK